jgi:hypothetical protein
MRISIGEYVSFSSYNGAARRSYSRFGRSTGLEFCVVGSRILRGMHVSALSLGFKGPRIRFWGRWLREGRESDVASLAPFRFDSA